MTFKGFVKLFVSCKIKTKKYIFNCFMLPYRMLTPLASFSNFNGRFFLSRFWFDSFLETSENVFC